MYFKINKLIVLYFSEIGHLKFPRVTLNLYFFFWGHIPVPLALVFNLIILNSKYQQKHFITNSGFTIGHA